MGLRTFFVPFRALQAVGLLSFFCCTVSKNRRLHAAAIAVITTILVAGIWLTRFRLGQFELR